MISNVKNNLDKLIKTTTTDKYNNKNLNVFPLDYKYITKFRKQKLEERIKISKKIMIKYPDRVPIIVDCKKEINLDKNKYLVPNNINLGQLMYILKKKININKNQSIFLLCNNTLLLNTELINSLYNKHKDYDGFLYIILSLENTFGN